MMTVKMYTKYVSGQIEYDFAWQDPTSDCYDPLRVIKETPDMKNGRRVRPNRPPPPPNPPPMRTHRGEIVMYKLDGSKVYLSEKEYNKQIQKAADDIIEWGRAHSEEMYGHKNNHNG